MAQNPNAIMVPGTFRCYVAPVGTTAPADETTAMPSGWVEVGYTTEDGTSFTTNPTFNEIRSHQSDYPTRIIKTADTADAALTLQEWSKQNFITAFGGGTVTAVTAGHYRFDPPSSGSSTPVAICLELVDGSKAYRVIMPKVRAKTGVTLPLHKTDAAGLPITLSAEASSSALPWYMLTNDPAFQ